MMTKITFFLTFALATSIACCPLFAAGEQREFTPSQGFAGESAGNGTLEFLLGKPRVFHVQSHGIQLKDDTFRLEQKVTFQGKPPEDRVWMLRTISPGHYAGTLSDAVGSVTGWTSGSHLSLEYRIKGPLVMHQQLQLMLDGKTIDNVGVITLLGIPIGHLHETIIR